jgi:hypothetical protein
MQCEYLIDAYIYLLASIYNLILLLASFLVCDGQSLRNYPNNLPITAACLFFVTAIVDYVFFTTEFSSYGLHLFFDLSSWILDCISRLCLLFFSMHRIKTLSDPKKLLYYMTLSILITMASFSFLVFANVFDPTFEYADISLGLYSATDFLSLSLDFYLAYLVSKVGRLGQGLAPRLREMVTGPGLSIFLGCTFCVTSLVITNLGRDPYYIYYTFLYTLRILMLQIFNIKLVLKLFKKKLQATQDPDAKRNTNPKEILYKIRKKAPKVFLIVIISYHLHRQLKRRS